MNDAASTGRAQKMYDFIVSNIDAGRTCYLATSLRVTKIGREHISMVRVRGNALEVCCRGRWLDYTWTALSAS